MCVGAFVGVGVKPTVGAGVKIAVGSFVGDGVGADTGLGVDLQLVSFFGSSTKPSKQ
jgi:hypothetical protein